MLLGIKEIPRISLFLSHTVNEGIIVTGVIHHKISNMVTDIIFLNNRNKGMANILASMGTLHCLQYK